MAGPQRIAVAGSGRMGQAIARRIDECRDQVLAGLWSRGDDLDELLEKSDVLIDFSMPGATRTVVEAALAHSVPLVCGVTGLGDEELELVDGAADSIAVVFDRNMSLGVAVLDTVLADAAAALGPEFAVTIHETHHEHKQDAPSGTALKLGETVVAARGSQADEPVYESERRGEVPGDHEVRFESATERLSFAHSVTTRDVFADGALRAAHWVATRSPGRYSMRDVLSGE